MCGDFWFWATDRQQWFLWTKKPRFRSGFFIAILWYLQYWWSTDTLNVSVLSWYLVLSKLGQFWKRSNSLLIHFTSGSFINFPFDLSTNYSILLKIYSYAGPIGNRIWPIITQCGIHALLLNIPFCTWPEACFLGEIEMGVTSHISFFWFNLHLSFFLF